MTIIWSPSARADLTNAYTYIAADDPEAAERVVRAIVRAAEGLAEFPAMGRVGALPGTRERIMSRYRYKIVYRAHGEQIEILRIIHTAQNWPPGRRAT
jgi:toxin ParE1/3/4